KAEIITTSPQKKRTLGERLAGLFNKGKKAEEKPVEEPQRITPFPGYTERKSRHRGEASSSTTGTENSSTTGMENLADLIQVTSNQPTDNWMLGVHGLKLTVHNKNNETVKTVVVEVRYYNDQNELLEKK